MEEHKEKLCAEDREMLLNFIRSFLVKEPLRTGLKKTEVIDFIRTKTPLKIYALLLDEDTLVLHRLKRS